jgi:hypothetical protein
MSRPIDITGEKFGKLTAIKPVGNNKTGQRIWLCQCECGNEKEVLMGSLRSGNTSSCGCIAREVLIERNLVHGMSKDNRLYNIWCRMRQRCNTSTCNDYKDYGGRGIRVCNEWNSFSAFNDWARSNGYKKNLSIDRIDSNGNYEPSNCRWATNKTQARNKRNNHFISFKGEKKTLSEWSHITGIDTSLIRYRLKQKWPLEKVLTK